MFHKSLIAKVGIGFAEALFVMSVTLEAALIQCWDLVLAIDTFRTQIQFPVRVEEQAFNKDEQTGLTPPHSYIHTHARAHDCLSVPLVFCSAGRRRFGFGLVELSPSAISH